MQNLPGLQDGPSDVWDVDQAQIADNQVEGLIRQLQHLRPADAVIAPRIPLASVLDQALGRVDSDGPDPLRLQHPAEPALTTADIEGRLEAVAFDPGEQRGAQGEPAAEVTMLADVLDPGRSRFLSTIGHALPSRTGGRRKLHCAMASGAWRV